MPDLGTRTHRRLLVVVGVVLVVTGIGMIALWPRAAELPVTDDPLGEVASAAIRSVQVFDDDPDPVRGTSGEFAVIVAEIMEGPDTGRVVELEVLTEGYPEFNEGDRVSLARAETGDGVFQYYITDFQRTPVLLVLVGLFVAAVLLVSRWHGVRALIGLGLSLLIVVQFVVPAILAGRNPPMVAWVGAMAVMIVTLYLTHGLNEMTTSAVVGTAAALTVTVALGLAFISRGKITGFASDDAVFARFAVGELDLQGLVLAGLIIAALGVLDDVTVSQASTVFALHDTDRRLTWPALFARAMKVGRDHIASVVNTLFLAYAGASLALLVLFSTSGLPLGEILNSEVLAEEIIKTVVGSLGLITAVPFTTALAATVAVRRSPDAPPAGGGHVHGRGAATALGARGAARSATTSTRSSTSSGLRDRGATPAAHTDEPGPEDTDELSADEKAYRSWVNYLREGPEARSGRHPDSSSSRDDTASGGASGRQPRQSPGDSEGHDQGSSPDDEPER